MSLAMTKTEREAFLADIHVAVISVADGAGGPLTIPIWYAYDRGHDIRFVTGTTSRKAVLIRQARRLSLCVQTESPPYKYVSVEGPVVLAEPEFERDVRQIAYRYLGQQMGDQYLKATAGERPPGSMVLVRMTPKRWLTVDYSKMSLGG